MDFESWPAMLGLTGGLGGLDLFDWIHQLQLCRKTALSYGGFLAEKVLRCRGHGFIHPCPPVSHPSMSCLNLERWYYRSACCSIKVFWRTFKKHFSAASRLWPKSPHLRGDLCHRLFCKPSTTTQEKPNVGLIPHRQFTKNGPLRVVIYPSSTKHQSVSNFLLPRRSELRVLFQNTKVML